MGKRRREEKEKQQPHPVQFASTTRLRAIRADLKAKLPPPEPEPPEPVTPDMAVLYLDAFAKTQDHLNPHTPDKAIAVLIPYVFTGVYGPEVKRIVDQDADGRIDDAEVSAMIDRFGRVYQRYYSLVRADATLQEKLNDAGVTPEQHFGEYLTTLTRASDANQDVQAASR